MSIHTERRANVFINTYCEFKQACIQFKNLTTPNKVMTVALAVMASIATFFLLGVGGVFTFNALVKVLSPSAQGSRVMDPQNHQHQDVSLETLLENFTEARREQFENGIERWLDDDTVTGNKQKAAARIRQAYYGNEQELNLKYFDLSSIPPEIGRLSSLRLLELKYNKLQRVPKEIGRLRSLRGLDLFENELESLPREIGKLEALHGFDLSCNQLRWLPREIGQLSELQRLNLGCNKLERLPCEIGQLAKLRVLNLASNSLTTLPSQIGSLVSLTDLYLNNNKLRDLPDEMGDLMALNTLNLYRNRELQRLPETMDRLTNLKNIGIKYTMIPRAI